jgi:methionine-S-sulfoxide reductase
MKKQITTLAGGCFWGVEDLLRRLPGILNTTVGYTGGQTENPVYKEVCTGKTGHAEAIQIEFDADQISFKEVLQNFFKLHDPTTVNRQGNDVGTQYRSAIFFHSPEQKLIAENTIAEIAATEFWKKPIVTALVPAAKFYSAEDYHQDYLIKNPGGYTCHFYRD